MTVDERLARRFDPLAMKERASAAATEPYGVRVERAAAVDRDVVVGRRNPELLLPFEVFRHLFSTAFAEDPTTRAIFREGYERTARSLGLNPVVWTTLERASRPYLETLEKERTLAAGLETATDAERSRILASITVVQEPQCRLRIEALKASRRALGGEAFDRFLYQVVAPEMTVQSVGPANPAELRHLDGGCR